MSMAVILLNRSETEILRGLDWALTGAAINFKQKEWERGLTLLLVLGFITDVCTAEKLQLNKTLTKRQRIC